VRIALANLRYPASPEESIVRVVDALGRANGARIMCFPECYVPGYRGLGHSPPSVVDEWLERAWARIADAARAAGCAAVIGTERWVGGKLVATALVIDANGKGLGFQDKVQIDPTVRYAARHGAELVFHPHYSAPEPGAFRPATFADPVNTFHEKAALCRAAENTIYFATVNYATAGSPTTSAVVDPEGVLVASQPYGEAGLLAVEIDLAKATRLLANRCKS
jgi:predicted amidohydrolase